MNHHDTTDRPDAGTPHEREDMLHRLPALPSMADWRKRVDEHLKERAALDHQRVQQAQQPHPDGRSLARQAEQATGQQEG